MLEKYVNVLLQSHMIDHDVIHGSHGFMEEKSAVDAIFNVCEYISENINSHCFAVPYT